MTSRGDVKVMNSCDPLAKDDAALGEGTVRSLLDLAAETAGAHSRCRDMERVGPAMDESLLKRVCHLVLYVSYACGNRINYSSLCSREQLELILDVYSTVDVVRKRDNENLANIDRHTRRLCFTMHYERNKVMSSLPTRKRYGL